MPRPSPQQRRQDARQRPKGSAAGFGDTRASRRAPGRAVTQAEVLAQQTEAEFQRQIVELAELRGWWWHHIPDSRRDNPGRPDLLLVHPEKRRVLFLEVKSERGRVTLAQSRMIEALDGGRTRAAVVRPSDWDVIEASL